MALFESVIAAPVWKGKELIVKKWGQAPFLLKTGTK